MKLLAALVAAAAVLGGAAAQADQKHQFETPKGTVVVTVVHGPPASAAKYRSDVAEASSEESSLPPLAESSSEESSELSRLAESSSEGSFGKVGTDDLTHFVLPPEPAAARGYRPLGAGAAAAAADSFSEGSQGAPCLENCEAEEAAANQAGGQVVFSQPLGDVSGSSGWAPAPGARTDAAQGVNNPSWTIVPQTGIDSSTSMPSASSIPAGSHMANLLSKVTQPLPGNTYASPEERRVQRLEVLEAAERARREQEKSQLAASMKEHQANLLKIEQMSRALRWQYTELRRQHNLLRTHIAANKATYEQLGGDDEYKGTDLDIEAKQAPNTYETLDDIAPINPRVDAAGKERITNDAVASHMKQSKVLDAMHAGQNKAIDAVFGAKAEKAEKDAAAALAAAKAAESS